MAVAGNLRAESMPQTLLDAALDSFGRCDVCFNNSGLLEAGSIEALDIERVCNMVRVNVEGTFRVAYTFLQHFAAQGSGHLVNTSFALSQRVQPAAGAYAATKYAVEALTEALRIELSGTHVRISCVDQDESADRSARLLGKSRLRKRLAKAIHLSPQRWRAWSCSCWSSPLEQRYRRQRKNRRSPWSSRKLSASLLRPAGDKGSDGTGAAAVSALQVICGGKDNGLPSR